MAFGPAPSPDSPAGAAIYAVIVALCGVVLLRLARFVSKRAERLFPNPTAAMFLAQLLRAFIVIGLIILYADLIPALRAIGTTLLAGASVVSIVIGLAAQSTLGNLVAGVSLLLYHPFRVGDELQVTTPRGLMTGTIASVSLGYTILRTAAGEEIIVPNNVMASAVMIRTGAGERPA